MKILQPVETEFQHFGRGVRMRQAQLDPEACERLVKVVAIHQPWPSGADRLRQFAVRAATEISQHREGKGALGVARRAPGTGVGSEMEFYPFKLFG